jgi:hypothetical protein
MLLHDLLSLEVPRLQTWAPPVSGVLTFGLMFLGARSFLRRQAALPGSENIPDRLPRDPIKTCVGERRAEPRRQGNPIEVLLTDLQGGVPRRGWVLDRSLGGLRIWFPHGVEAGQVIAVQRLDAPARSPWVPLQVKHSRRQQAAWMMGGTFVNAPTLAGMLFT